MCFNNLIGIVTKTKANDHVIIMLIKTKLNICMYVLECGSIVVIKDKWNITISP